MSISVKIGPVILENIKNVKKKKVNWTERQIDTEKNWPEKILINCLTSNFELHVWLKNCPEARV